MNRINVLLVVSIFAVCILLSLACVSALTKSTEAVDGSKYQKVNIQTNGFLGFFKEDVAQFELVDNTDYCKDGTDCHAIIKVTTDQNINNLLSKVEFRYNNKDNPEINGFQYKVSLIDYENDIEVAKTQLMQKSGGKIKGLEQVSVSDIDTTDVIFTKTKSYEDLGNKILGVTPAGTTYYILIEATKPREAAVEWIPTMAGYRLTEWSMWNAGAYLVPTIRWRMENDSSEPNVAQFTARENNGNPMAGNYTAGKNGLGLNLMADSPPDASAGEYADIPYNSAFDPFNFTICTWVNNYVPLPNNGDPSIDMYIWNTQYGSNTGVYFLGRDHASGKFVFSTQNGPSVLSKTVVTTNRWYFVCGMYNSNTKEQQIWVDGIYENSTTSSEMRNQGNGNTALHFGGRTEAAGYHMYGMLDDVVLFNRTLTAKEMSDLSEGSVLNPPENLTFTGNENITRYYYVPSSITQYVEAYLNLTSYSSNFTDGSECYQETANVSTACGGLDTGAYDWAAITYSDAITNGFDGNWGTYTKTAVDGGGGMLYINYSKPTNADLAFWQIKTDNRFQNFTIQENCFSQNPIRLRLHFEHKSIGSGGTASCWDGSGWSYEGLYNNDGNSVDYIIYEEAIIWDFPPVANNSVSNTRLSINATSIFNQSGYTGSSPRISNDYAVSTSSPIYGINFAAQTFTMPFDGNLTSVYMKLQRSNQGCTPGNMDVNIKATDGDGKPTGSALATYSFDDADVSQGSNGAWYKMRFNINLNNGVKYAVVASCSGDGGNNENWLEDASPGNYAGGSSVNSYDNQASWDIRTRDKLFKLNFKTASNETATTIQTTNFASTINNYLSTCTFVGGYCQVPFIFHSDTAGIWRYSDLVLDNKGIAENSFTYDATTYQTSTATYSMNVSFDSAYYTGTNAAYLWYNGTSYAATLTGTGNDRVASYSFTHAGDAEVGTKTFKWIYNLNNGSATTQWNSTAKTQTLGQTEFNICNSTLNIPYLNITFKDETTGANINATTDLSTWTYYIGDGSVTKSLIYTNTTQNPRYTYCFTPSDKTVIGSVTYQYGLIGSTTATNYPQRQYYTTFSYTNATTQLPLYLLSSANGIYTTFVATDGKSNIAPGLTVTVERQFNGVWTVVGQGSTDSAGSITLWVNPNYDHRFTFSQGTCVYQTTLRPTQSTYTISVPCLSSQSQYYVSPIEGIKYRRDPMTGFLGKGMQTFTFWIYSSKSNIVSAKFELVKTSTSAVIGTNSSSSCNGASGCTMTLNYNVTVGDDIKGRYYVDIGSGYFLIEGDARWREIEINQSGTSSSLNNFFKQFSNFFNEWGADDHECSSKYSHLSGNTAVWNSTCTADPYCKFSAECYTDGYGTHCSYMCIPGDMQNKQEFSRIVAFFMVFCIAFAIFGRFTGYDAMNPGWLITALTGIVLFMSVVGGKTGEGFFYYDGLTKIHFVNNYILAAILVAYTVGYWINLQRRQG